MLPYVNTDPSAIVSSTPNRPSSDSIICCSGEDNNFSLLIHLIQSLLIKHVALLAYVIHVQQNEHNALVLNLHYRFCIS